jgi:hypothetical protein
MQDSREKGTGTDEVKSTREYKKKSIRGMDRYLF